MTMVHGWIVTPPCTAIAWRFSLPSVIDSISPFHIASLDARTPHFTTILTPL